ncbi:ROK family protein [Paracidovorax anthurii]|uniref:Fructokinase n=1 Tax=Paracidovorax anthurii TaxID=78229 RepID=A0A328Z5F1_9BURK|nr:ROK family protein [Paracidovorax anthurii]RAR81004.1 fructokinase [Paracidovorax anthurii]
MEKSPLAPAPRHRIGIDVGGTKIEGILLDDHGKECARTRCATAADEGYDAVVLRIAGVYRDLAKGLAQGEHTLGIGTPGSLSPATGLLRNCNAVALNGHPLHHDLEQALGRGFALANDANCFALAETRLGAAAPYTDVLALVLGTGVGAGLVVGGELIQGRNGIGGEWGHMVLDPSGPQCYCGRRGCVERYLSGPALERQYAQWSGAPLDAARIAQRARAGEKEASAVMDRFLDYFAQAVASAVALVDPQAIVIGGGLAGIDALYAQGVERLHALVFCDRYETPVLRNRLGNSAGVVGAAMIGI